MSIKIPKKLINKSICLSLIMLAGIATGNCQATEENIIENSTTENLPKTKKIDKNSKYKENLEALEALEAKLEPLKAKLEALKANLEPLKALKAKLNLGFFARIKSITNKITNKITDKIKEHPRLTALFVGFFGNLTADYIQNQLPKNKNNKFQTRNIIGRSTIAALLAGVGSKTLKSISNKETTNALVAIPTAILTTQIAFSNGVKQVARKYYKKAKNYYYSYNK